jgi:hypothetical protein
VDAPLYCGVTGKEQPIRIAAGFYGVHRSTALTVESLRENLLKPLQEVGAVDVFVHAIIVTELEDGTHVKEEAGVELCPKDYLLLRACVSSTSAQEVVDNKHHLKSFAKTGVWESAETVGFRNLTGPFPRVVPPAIADEGVRLNMLRSRFSMQQVGRLMVKHEKDIGVKYTHIVLARPDVGLVSPLIWKPPPVHLQGVALHAETMWLRVPNMQHYYGLNDRLSYGSRDALLYVSNEFDKMNKSNANFSFGSEAKFCNHLLSAGKIGLGRMHVGVTPVCNVRVRATGEVEDMDFYIRGDPSPASSCQGLSVFTTSEDTKDACLGVKREDLTDWGWKVPPLNASLQMIHIPKTGGTTLEDVAYAHGVSWGAYKTEWNHNGEFPPKTALGKPDTWQPCSPWHIPPAVYRAHGESGAINGGRQQTFCVVRDPIDRAISQFTFEAQSTNGPNINSSKSSGKDLKCKANSLNRRIHTVLGGAAKDIQRVEKEFPLVGSLKKTATCVECATVADCHWLPQWLYVEGTCDHVLRFERLAEDFELLMKRFEGTTRGTKTLAAAVRNANASLASGCTTLTKHDLDETSRALLSSVYEYDFEMFGYSTEFGAHTPVAKKDTPVAKKANSTSNDNKATTPTQQEELKELKAELKEEQLKEERASASDNTSASDDENDTTLAQEQKQEQESNVTLAQEQLTEIGVQSAQLSPDGVAKILDDIRDQLRLENGLTVEKREGHNASADSWLRITTDEADHMGNHKHKKQRLDNATSVDQQENITSDSAAADDTGKHDSTATDSAVTDAPGKNFIATDSAAAVIEGRLDAADDAGKQENVTIYSAADHLVKHKKRGSHHGKAADQQDNMTVALCSLMTLRMEAPHLLPWVAYHLLIGVDQIHLYHDDRSGMWNEKLMQLHRPLMNYLHAHEKVTIHSMAEQNLESQQDQIDHCGALVSKNLVGGKPPATWVGNWDIDEMAVGDRPHDSAKGVFDIKHVLRSLGARPQTTGVLIPRFTMGGPLPRDEFPDASLFEMAQWSHRLNWHSHGKAMWKPSEHTGAIGGAGHSLWTDVPGGIVLPDGSQRPYLLREDNTTDALVWESPDYLGPGNAAPEKHLVGPKPEWLATNVGEGKKEFRATLPLLALPLRLYHFDRRSTAECWRRVAMYRDISDALRHERALLHEESQERKESLDMDASIDQVIQGLGSDAFDGSKYDLDCNDGLPTSGALEYDVEDASLSSPKIIEMVRHELGTEGLAIAKQERIDYIQFLQAFRRNLASWDEIAYWLPEKEPTAGK